MGGACPDPSRLEHKRLAFAVTARKVSKPVVDRFDVMYVPVANPRRGEAAGPHEPGFRPCGVAKGADPLALPV